MLSSRYYYIPRGFSTKDVVQLIKLAWHAQIHYLLAINITLLRKQKQKESKETLIVGR